MHRGLMRWHIMYNLVVLRLISFGMDLHWARRPAAGVKSAQASMQQTTDDPTLKVSRDPGHDTDAESRYGVLAVLGTAASCSI